MASTDNRKILHLLLLLAWLLLLAFFFAQVEIQIEGARGWAASLPTWRIEGHWLLDLFWGGRPLTGYHAWIFSFMLLVPRNICVFVSYVTYWRELTQGGRHVTKVSSYSYGRGAQRA